MRWAMSDGEEYEDDVAEQSTSDERTWRSSPEDNLLRAWEHIQALIHWNGDIVSQFFFYFSAIWPLLVKL
jgi:hypothetical protein